jgi:hypothetical protein
MQVDLAVQRIRQKTGLGVVKRHTSLVTASFYAKNVHLAIVYLGFAGKLAL